MNGVSPRDDHESRLDNRRAIFWKRHPCARAARASFAP